RPHADAAVGEAVHLASDEPVTVETAGDHPPAGGTQVRSDVRPLSAHPPPPPTRQSRADSSILCRLVNPVPFPGLTSGTRPPRRNPPGRAGRWSGPGRRRSARRPPPPRAREAPPA